MHGARQRLDELEASPALCHVAAARPEDLLFMDIESCGLYGASVFLIGLMYFQDGQLLFEQCLARNYAEEPAVLQSFASRLEQTGALVTFNGRAFDMNMIRDRCAFHRLDLDDARLPHLDLLHECRRRWRGRLPNCRLQTLEAHLCGRQRVGDIPGWAIPDAYHRFVDTGDARQLRDILHHNLLDLLTMAQILNLVLTGQTPSRPPETSYNDAFYGPPETATPKVLRLWRNVRRNQPRMGRQICSPGRSESLFHPYGRANPG